MSVNVSVRLDDDLAERLRLRSKVAGESLSDRLRRYAEEGARRDDHPLVTFRDGPSGRRAGIVGGPDIWEISLWLEEIASADSPDRTDSPDRSHNADELVADGVVTRAEVDAAIAYAAAFPDEIAARLELHRYESGLAATR